VIVVRPGPEQIGYRPRTVHPGDATGAGAGDADRWFRAVVFDLDGLLVDSEPLWRLAEIEVFGGHGVPLTDELCRTTKGRFVGEVAEHWYRRFGWTGPSPAAVADEVVDRVAELLAERVALRPGAAGLLEWCEGRGLAMAVASSSGHRLIGAALARHGLQERFATVSSAEDVGAGKPDPAVYLAAAGALGVPPDRCLALEDAELGARAALAAGMACILVPEEGDEDTGVPVDARLASLAEVPAAWSAVASAFLARRR
jgi:HAD superfamily hydrolase (TIGR01509 family)